MSDDALFDPPPGTVRAAAPADPYAGMSTQQRRTARQHDALAAGLHPVGLMLGIRVRLHPKAAPVDDRQAAGRRCGNCVFREHNAWGYAKCTRSDATTSRCSASDCRAWWPGCIWHRTKGMDQ